MRTLYKFMHRDSQEDPIKELASFYESFTTGPYAQLWDDDLIALPSDRWWILAEDAWPMLSQLFRKLYQLPASAASAERVWSAGELVLSKRRTKLTRERSSDLLYMYWNERILKAAKQKDPIVIGVAKGSAAIHRCPTLQLIDIGETLEFPEADFELELDDHAEEATSTSNLSATTPSTADTDEEICGKPDEEEVVHQAQPVQSTRTFEGPVCEHSTDLTAIGKSILVYFHGPQNGWYEGVVEAFDDEIGYTVLFEDGYTYQKLSRRRYGPSLDWVVPMLD